MVRHALFATALAICTLWPGAHTVLPRLSAPQIETSVDRTELARGETLTYTIRVFDRRQGMQLDLTPLTEEFDVLGTRTSSQIRSVNGSRRILDRLYRDPVPAHRRQSDHTRDPGQRKP